MEAPQIREGFQALAARRTAHARPERDDVEGVEKHHSFEGNAIMEPMKPMAPMKPMEPMKPMDMGPAWWPDDLGQPNASGAQNGMRYAFFSTPHRLVIETNGKMEMFDSGDHAIHGVSQQQSLGQSLVFTSQHGEVKTAELARIE